MSNILMALLFLVSGATWAEPQASYPWTDLRGNGEARERFIRLTTTAAPNSSLNNEFLKLYELAREFRDLGFEGGLEIQLPYATSLQVNETVTQAAKLWGLPDRSFYTGPFSTRGVYEWDGPKLSLRFGSAENARKAQFAVVLTREGQVTRGERLVWKHVNARSWFVLKREGFRAGVAKAYLEHLQDNERIKGTEFYANYVRHPLEASDLEDPAAPLTFEDLANQTGQIPWLGSDDLPDNWKKLAPTLRSRSVILTDLNSVAAISKVFALYRYMQLHNQDYEGFERPVILINLSPFFLHEGYTHEGEMRQLNEALARINRDLVNQLVPADRPAESADRRSDVAALDLRTPLLPTWTSPAQTTTYTDGTRFRRQGMHKGQFLVLQLGDDLPRMLKEALLSTYTRHWAVLSRASSFEDFVMNRGVPHFNVAQSVLMQNTALTPTLQKRYETAREGMDPDLLSRLEAADSGFRFWDLWDTRDPKTFPGLPFFEQMPTPRSAKAKAMRRLFRKMGQVDSYNFTDYVRDAVRVITKLDCNRALANKKY